MSDRKCQCCAAKERAAEDYNVLHTTMTDEIRRMRDAHAAVVNTLRARLAECERERDALRADRDEERLLHARLSKEYHDATRRVCASLAGQVETLTKERDAAIRERDEALASAHGLTLLVGDMAAERDAAIQRAARAEGKLRETTYAALAAREQGEADTVARIVAWLDDPEGEPISHEMLRGYGLQDYSQRVETCRDMFAEMIKAGAWRGKEQA